MARLNLDLEEKGFDWTRHVRGGLPGVPRFYPSWFDTLSLKCYALIVQDLKNLYEALNFWPGSDKMRDRIVVVKYG